MAARSLECGDWSPLSNPLSQSQAPATDIPHCRAQTCSHTANRTTRHRTHGRNPWVQAVSVPMNDSLPSLDPISLSAPVRVLIVPDKFKGTLTARQAAATIALGWKLARPQDTLDLLPMSDGGDGFGEVMSALLRACPRQVTTVDAAQRPCRARWWWAPQTHTAIIESAEVIGLARLSPKQFHPYALDTRGLGKVLTAVARSNPRRCIIGIGGSATNDGGFGMARALGWRFIDRAGDEIHAWTDLDSCRQIVRPACHLKLGCLTVALDVQNPLLGPKGCTRVYGPQKGLRPRDFKRSEGALLRLSELMKTQGHGSLDEISGAGAAGGLGFGLMAFLNAKPRKGFSLFAREARLTGRIRAADLVITGEGCLDPQSLMGKGIGELLSLCERRGVPCIALGGRTELEQSDRWRFARIYSLTSLATGRQALSRPTVWLTRAARKAGTELVS